FKIISLLSLLIYLAGCGQMGPLYLPQDDQGTDGNAKVQTNGVSTNKNTQQTSQSEGANE
ncbi:LPS translocon maturation chaperone LptM, partial [Corynebacterium parakroppenstedtii]|uniref:LPS translocon maturation chaperone LptM n=1 Tax=Corynebacterium parakroppenstedtii TaxID=2828363 RepID=UPI001F3E3070